MYVLLFLKHRWTNFLSFFNSLSGLYIWHFNVTRLLPLFLLFCCCSLQLWLQWLHTEKFAHKPFSVCLGECACALLNLLILGCIVFDIKHILNYVRGICSFVVFCQNVLVKHFSLANRACWRLYSSTKF